MVTYSPLHFNPNGILLKCKLQINRWYIKMNSDILTSGSINYLIEELQHTNQILICLCVLFGIHVVISIVKLFKKK